MTFSVYADKYQWFTGLKNVAVVSSLVFILLLLIHAFCSIYLFGFPKLKWQIRVVHIYVGYGIFIFTFLSQSIIGFEPYHAAAYFLNWFLIIVHVGLSARFMLKRNFKKQPEKELSFFTGGKIFRDTE
jgi:hypothetical protein